MRKIKRPKIGEIVLATKYVDKDMYDPWTINTVEIIVEDKHGLSYLVDGRFFKHVFKITPEESRERQESWLKLNK